MGEGFGERVKAWRNTRFVFPISARMYATLYFGRDAIEAAVQVHGEAWQRAVVHGWLMQRWEGASGASNDYQKAVSVSVSSRPLQSPAPRRERSKAQGLSVWYKTK